jgi:hypothetical protein
VAVQRQEWKIAISPIVAPSSVEATVTGPYGHRAAICGANSSAEHNMPGMKTIGVISLFQIMSGLYPEEL